MSGVGCRVQGAGCRVQGVPCETLAKRVEKVEAKLGAEGKLKRNKEVAPAPYTSKP